MHSGEKTSEKQLELQVEVGVMVTVAYQRKRGRSYAARACLTTETSSFEVSIINNSCHPLVLLSHPQGFFHLLVLQPPLTTWEGPNFY
jgi:hypothetical protein